MHSLSVPIADLPALENFARHLAACLPCGSVVALNGTLGAGKTRFVQEMAAAVGIDPSEVTSPTFVLCREYHGEQFTIYHADAYRLRDLDEFCQLGPEEWFAAQGWVFIEWADRVTPALPRDSLTIEIEITGETSRQFTLTAQGEMYEQLLAKLEV